MDPNKIKSFNWYRGSLEWLQQRTFFLTVTGSRAYGTATETSDWDYKGIAIPPKEYFYGFLSKFEQAENKDGLDITIFDVRKFIALACDANPSILEMLFTDEADWVIPSCDECNEVWAKLWFNRQLFVTKKAKHTFSGYAHSQMHRLKTHRGFLLNPPKSKPTRQQFSLPDYSTIDKEQLAVFNARVRKLEDQFAGTGITKDQLEEVDETMVTTVAAEIDLNKSLIPVIIAERKYANAMRVFKQYETWKLERNPKRAALEAKFGMDTKHAAHLVRLLRMGYEILTTGNVIVKRPDAEELLSIRNGAWSYDRLEAYAFEMDMSLGQAYDKATIPNAPNKKILDDLCVSLVASAL
jgi:uncharacterized protein